MAHPRIHTPDVSSHWRGIRSLAWHESVPAQDKAMEIQDPSTSNGDCLDGAVGVVVFVG